MLAIPAIDLRGGKCVRLRQGDYGRETIFGDDPVAVARRWRDEGAAYLHLVDLDGAKHGRPMHAHVVEAILREVGLPCQLGGGIRTEEAIRQMLEVGVDRVIIGTQAVRQPEWFAAMAQAFPQRLVLGVDAKNGRVATDGWLDVSEASVFEVVARFEALPLAAIVYTDIARDGMLTGPNVEMTAALARQTRHLVIASGGVAQPEDVFELQRRGVSACILGRSIYEGAINLRSLLDYLQMGTQNQNQGL